MKTTTGGHDAQSPRRLTTRQIMKALSEPVRLELLACLGRSDDDVKTLARRLNWDSKNMSHHLAVFRRLGLVHYEQLGQRHPYRLDPSVAVRTDGTFTTFIFKGVCGGDLRVTAPVLIHEDRMRQLQQRTDTGSEPPPAVSR